MKLFPSSILAVFGLAASAQAQLLLTPTGETNVSGVSEFFNAANMVNDTGLSGAATIANYTTITHSAAGGANAWTTDAPGGGGSDYYSSGGTAGIFDLPLGGLYNVTEFGATRRARRLRTRPAPSPLV